MKKVVLSASIILISLLHSCSSSKNIGTTSMPDPKIESPKPVAKSSTSDASNSANSASATNEKATKSSSSKPTTTTKTKDGKSKDIVVKEERVTVIEEPGTAIEPGKYYVIIGSFKVIENAKKYKTQLIIDHYNPILLQNEDGLYRVSVGAFLQETPARDRISSIRAESEKYSDVWLLVQKQ